jgi:hypothetical protein
MQVILTSIGFMNFFRCLFFEFLFFTNADVVTIKVWDFWEGHKIWKNLRLTFNTFDKSIVFCARNSVVVKKSTKIFQNKSGQVVLYKLYI